MKTEITILTLCTLYYFAPVLGRPELVCYWDQTSSENRTGIGKIEANRIQFALSNCTRMIIGFAEINDTTFELSSIPKIPFNCTEIKCPKFSLGIGRGLNYDPKFIEMSSRMFQFKEHLLLYSIIKAMTDNPEYDGVDLAWQFPTFAEDRIIQEQMEIMQFTLRELEKIMEVVTPLEKPRDEVLREGFGRLVRLIFSEFEDMNKTVTVSVLPLSNHTKYYHPSIMSLFASSINVLAFDSSHPSNGEDVTLQLDKVLSHHYENVRFWLENVISSSKIIIGLPTFARTWMSPNTTNQLGKPGVVSQIPGILSYSEVCPTSPHYGKIIQRSNSTILRPGLGKLRHIVDIRSTDDDVPQDARIEGYYFPPDFIFMEAHEIDWGEIGGIALYELSLDDVDGVCTGEKFPYLKSAAEGLKRKSRY